MTTVQTNTHSPNTTFHVEAGAVRRVAAWFMMIVTAYGKANIAAREFDIRQTRIANLEAASDSELAELGIMRDRIVHHVYRDLLAS